MSGWEILYASDAVTLYCGDSREILPTLGDESVDLLVTDPPYGVSQRANTRKERFDLIAGDAPGEAEELLASVTPDLVRVTRRSRHLYTFGLALQHPLVPTSVDLIWDKGRLGSGNLASPWGNQHERIYFQVRAPDKHNAEKGTGTLASRMRRGSILSVRRLSANQVKRHPTEKPVALLQQIIESSSVHTELVLDPFAGSGSTLVAAVLEGRRAIGVELDERYALIAAERLHAAEAAMKSAVAA
jgi:DNA modification methylase